MNYLRLVEGLKKAGFAKLAVLGIATLSLSSCLKNKGTEYVEPDVAYLSVYNALPGANNADFVLDNQYVYTFSYGNFENSRYFQVFTGQRRAAFYKENLTAVTDTIRTRTVTMEKNMAYSLFLIGTQEEPETLLNKDEWDAPAQGTANIRFINLSPDIGELDLMVNTEGGDSTLFSAINYKQISDFSDLPAKNYSLKIKKGDEQIDVVNNISIGSGRTYTVLATGLAETETTSLKVSVKINEHR